MNDREMLEEMNRICGSRLMKIKELQSRILFLEECLMESACKSTELTFKLRKDAGLYKLVSENKMPLSNLPKE
jgi:hypothetical protein